MKVHICDDRARLPKKAGPNEIGYDLTCVCEIERDEEWDRKWDHYPISLISPVSSSVTNTLPEAAYPIPFANKFKKTIGDSRIRVFDTGIRVEPPAGYYCEIVPRSSMAKHGVMLLNSVGIIDPTYRGTLKVCLAGPVPPCPFNLCQLILRPVPPNFVVTKVETLTDTTRGAGGFGSTNGVGISE